MLEARRVVRSRNMKFDGQAVVRAGKAYNREVLPNGAICVFQGLNRFKESNGLAADGWRKIRSGQPEEDGKEQKAGKAAQPEGIGIKGIGPRGFFGGTGGSRMPKPVSLRGGPPPRREEACGSGSRSFSLNS